MSDSSDRAKPASVAAFLFLPQFGQMFRGSSHLIPVFMRTIARLFVQAALLPPTHPSALYGDPGVEKCGFLRMMGDAWYTIRSTAATPYQWSVFCSVLMMAFVLLTSIISTLFSLSSTFVTKASAQIFNSALGPSDIANMPPVTGLGGGCTSQTPFCRAIPNDGSAYSDYAIDLLDKTLRMGANGSGGSLQNATGALMQVYNAGILFVAACLLFWLIISIVVDIAKTGQVGGGRHNLVWAPIRIVFALGMMVPLGTSGFSSGQFVVMKIAEWGSNFGTNGWNAYLKGIGSAAVVPNIPLGDDLMGLVSNYERMWICRVAHNGYGYQSNGTSFSTNFGQQASLKLASNVPDNGQMSYTYTNGTADDLCGQLTFPTGNSPQLQGVANGTGDAVAKAGAQVQIAMQLAWMNLFVSGYSKGSSGSSQMDQTQMGTLANDFACDFVSQHIWGTVGGTSGPDVLSLNCGGGGNSNGSYGKCSSGTPGSGIYPDMTCVDDYSSEMNQATMTGLIGYTIYNAAQSAVATYYGNLSTVQLFGSRGWADMSTFFQHITAITSGVNSTMTNQVSITFPSTLDSGDGQSKKVLEVMSKFSDWWATVPMGQPAPSSGEYCNNGTVTATPGGSANTANNCATRAHNSSGSATWGAFTPAKEATGGSTINTTDDAARTAASQAEGLKNDPGGWMATLTAPIFQKFLAPGLLPDPSDTTTTNKYPLMILAGVGNHLINLATLVMSIITGIVMALALSDPWGDGGAALPVTMIVNLMGDFMNVFLMCGFVLAFYLPLLPFIRVSHAVLTWMVSVFEAVMLVPIACLSFLDTEKEGMYAKHPFINWLDLLVRPILTVIGYVGAILVFDGFFGYFQATFVRTTAADTAGSGMFAPFYAPFADVVIFTFIAYTACNTCFKMISIIPDAFFRWLPGGQASAATHWEAADATGAMSKMAGMASQSMGSVAKMGQEKLQLKQQAKAYGGGEEVD